MNAAAERTPTPDAPDDTRPACAEHPRSNHRLNLGAMNTALRHAEGPSKGRPAHRSRAERVYFALAMMRGGRWYRVDHAELADRTRYGGGSPKRARRTHERAIRELWAAGLIDYAPGFPTFNAAKGVPHRTAAWIRLSAASRMIATRDVPSESEIQRKAEIRSGRVVGGPWESRAQRQERRRVLRDQAVAVAHSTSRASVSNYPSRCCDVLSLTRDPAGPDPPARRAHAPPCTCADCFGRS